MRILLDENLDWRLMSRLPDHEVDSVPKIGWGGISNGYLLEKASEVYDVFIAIDRGIPLVLKLLSATEPGNFYVVEL